MKINRSMILFCILIAAGSLCFAAQNKTALSLYEKGVSEQISGNFYAAVDSFTEALQINENYGDAWFHLAQCTYELGEFDLALDYTLKAETYSRNFSEIRNLRALAYISLGQLKEAREVFEKVLKEYPNDVDSRFGLAQLDLFDGSLSAAEKQYSDALKRQASNKKALLSLALISAESGKTDAARNYIETALKYHSGEAQVHYLASYLEAKQGDYASAERRARSAVQIDGNYDKAYELLANILYSQKRYKEVIDLCDFRIQKNRSSTDAWFLKGLSQQRLNQIEDAIETYSTGLAITPNNEIMRAAMEQLIGDYVDVEDSRRTLWAQYHINRALEYKRNFDGVGERYEYQQALKIDPLNKDARQSFANLLYTEGYYELYLSQLEFLKMNAGENTSQDGIIQTDENSPKQKKTPQQIKNEDVMEALTSMMNNTLSKKWNVNPFYMDKTRWNLGIYFVSSNVQIFHPDAEHITAVAARDIFNGIPSTAVSVNTEPITSFGEAYRKSREAKCDYFVILSLDETERSITLDGSIYSARTGTLTSKVHAYRTGNDRYANVLRRFRQAVLDILPIRGKVIAHTGNTLLVDLGRSDGVVTGSEFDVVEKGSIYTVDKGTGIAYRDESKIGTFVIKTVNEEISEGIFSKSGFYDILNDGDELVLTSLPENDEISAQGDTANDTKPAADKKGSPATEAAVNAENADRNLQKAFRMRESTLINLIRSIN